jgi:hypothetical protein
MQTNLNQRLSQTMLPDNPSPDISNGNVMGSYIGLLCQGKSDFDQIEPFREDPFFALSLGLKTIPSSPTLRQRMDQSDKSDLPWCPVLLEESADLLSKVKAPLSGLQVKQADKTETFFPLDIDVSPFDNSGTKKQVFPVHTRAMMDKPQYSLI